MCTLLHSLSVAIANTKIMVLGTNSLFTSLQVALDSTCILQTTAARSMQFVAIYLERRREPAKQILDLQLICCESGTHISITQIASMFCDKTFK